MNDDDEWAENIFGGMATQAALKYVPFKPFYAQTKSWQNFA